MIIGGPEKQHWKVMVATGLVYFVLYSALIALFDFLILDELQVAYFYLVQGLFFSLFMTLAMPYIGTWGTVARPQIISRQTICSYHKATR